MAGSTQSTIGSPLAVLVLTALGIGIGAGASVWGIRASRKPGSFLYAARARVGTAPQDTSEADLLARHYGPERQSMNLEEWMVRDFFHDRRKGVFVDIWAADYKQYRNTWFLDTQLEWSGIAVDAQSSYRGGYETHRPRTKFFTLFVADHSQDTARLFLSQGAGASSSERERSGSKSSTTSRPTTTSSWVST